MYGGARCVRRLRAIVGAYPVACGGRSHTERTTMNIDTIVDDAFKSKGFRELAEAPISALRGVSQSDARALSQAFGINTIGELAELPFVKWANAIKTLAEQE